jgi:enoyl-CoA hydratase
MDTVSYTRDGDLATITLDDGKVNVLDRAVIADLGAAFDRAEADGVAVLLTGRDKAFSAGFDLNVLRTDRTEAAHLVHEGFALAARILAFPAPVAAACTGHAIGMGAFLLLSTDYRVGATGPFKFSAPEVALGMAIPRSAVEVCRQRLTPAAFTRAVLLSETFTPDNAVEAGWLDRVVDPKQLLPVTTSVATAMSTLDKAAYAVACGHAREPVRAALRAAMDFDFAAVRAG